MSIVLDNDYISKVGHHYWFIIHFEALKIVMKSLNDFETKSLAKKVEKNNFINKLTDEYLTLLSFIIENLMCSCKNHAKRLLIKNPFKSSNLNLFHWTILFHNSVNKRLNKTILNYDEAIEIYLSYYSYLPKNDDLKT